MDTQRKSQRAREYLRVSADKSGRMESPEQQHEVNGQHAQRHGWILGDPYAEQGAVSASRYSAKARAAFDRLAADLEGRRFGAEILIIWESSRGSRRVGEWVRLIEACEDAGVRVYVTSHGRLYDPADDRDRRSLLEDAVDSEWESAKLSQRSRRATASRAADGKPHGRIPYGYRRVYDPVTRHLTAQEPDPAEAAVVRELFARLRLGDSLKAIARDFEKRGVTTRGSAKFPPRPFTPEHLRPMALSPTYAGKRTHQPKGARRRKGALDGAVDGTWPPLVDAETFSAVRALLSDPARRTSRPGRAKHELSLIARCGCCGGPLTVTYRDGSRAYFCRDKSCVKIGADDLDRYAARLLCVYLAENIDRLTVAPGRAPELEAVRADLAAARADLADWRRRASRREVTAASFAAIEPGIVADIARLEERDRVLSAPPAFAGFLTPGKSVAAAWKDASVSARRQASKTVFSPACLGWLKVRKSPVPGHAAPVEQRVILDTE